MTKKLTEKQQRFVDEYIIDLNATQAAIRTGYSEKTSYSIGHEILKKPEIQEAIALANDKRAQRTEITADRVLQELAKIGFSDLRNVLTKNGHLIDPQDWDDDMAGAISSVEVVTTHQRGEVSADTPIEHTHKIKVWDKNSALEKMGKHLGMFVDRVDFTGAIDTKWSVEIVRPKDTK